MQYIQPSCAKPFSKQSATKPKRDVHIVSRKSTRFSHKNQCKIWQHGRRHFSRHQEFLRTSKALTLPDTDPLYCKIAELVPWEIVRVQITRTPMVRRILKDILFTLEPRGIFLEVVPTEAHWRIGIFHNRQVQPKTTNP